MAKKRKSMMDAIIAGEKPRMFYASTFDSFVSPIDGSLISSKYELREHEKKHNVVQVGNDLVNQKPQKNKDLV